MREALKRLRWRFRPGRFVPVECGTSPLEAFARPVAGGAALAETAHDVAYAQFAPPAAAELAASFELGTPETDHFPRAPAPVPPVRVYRLRGETRIFGKGLFLRDGAVVLLPVFEFSELGRLDYPAHRLSLDVSGDRALARLPERVRSIDEPCLYVAQGGETVWGHWLVDLLPRLVLGLSVPARMKVVIDADAPPWATDLLALVGVDRSRIVRHDKFRTTLVVSDLYVPSFLRFGNAFSPLADLAWGLLPASAGPATRRLYVSRSGLPGGSTIANAAEIEAMARARGFRVVQAERLDLPAKARLFSEARQVVGEFGSGLHNTVFSRAGTRVAVLQSSASTSFVQSGIGHRRGQPTGIVFGPSIEGGRTFRLPPALFAEALDRLDS